MGCFFAQTVVLGLWTALFPGKSTTRWLAGTLVLLVAAIALAVPMKMQVALRVYLSTGVLDVDLWTICANPWRQLRRGWSCSTSRRFRFGSRGVGRGCGSLATPYCNQTLSNHCGC